MSICVYSCSFVSIKLTHIVCILVVQTVGIWEFLGRRVGRGHPEPQEGLPTTYRSRDALQRRVPMRGRLEHSSRGWFLSSFRTVCPSSGPCHSSLMWPSCSHMSFTVSWFFHQVLVSCKGDLSVSVSSVLWILYPGKFLCEYMVWISSPGVRAVRSWSGTWLQGVEAREIEWKVILVCLISFDQINVAFGSYLCCCRWVNTTFSQLAGMVARGGHFQ